MLKRVSPIKWVVLTLLFLFDSAIVWFSHRLRPQGSVIPYLLVSVSSLLPLAIHMFSEARNGPQPKRVPSVPTAKTFRMLAVVSGIVTVILLGLAYSFSSLATPCACDPHTFPGNMVRAMPLVYLGILALGAAGVVINLRRSKQREGAAA
jgi:hypothetical protein